MKKLKICAAVGIVCCGIFSSVCAEDAQQKETQKEKHYEGDEEEQVIIWTGPGWYGGLWFEDEESFYLYRNDRYYRHDYDRDHRRHGDEHHEDEHRGDGHHGGEHHGGGGGGHGHK